MSQSRSKNKNRQFKLASDCLGIETATKLWSNEKFAWSKLRSPDANVCYFALAVLLDQWSLSREDCFLIVKSILCDRDGDSDGVDEVLVCNMLCLLGRVYSASFDDEVSKFLAAWVANDQLPNRIRLAAYFELEGVHKTKDHPFVDVFEKADRLIKRMDVLLHEHEVLKSKSMELIDWSFVNRILD